MAPSFHMASAVLADLVQSHTKVFVILKDSSELFIAVLACFERLHNGRLELVNTGKRRYFYVTHPIAHQIVMNGINLTV